MVVVFQLDKRIKYLICFIHWANHPGDLYRNRLNLVKKLAERNDATVHFRNDIVEGAEVIIISKNNTSQEKIKKRN
jgi:hypothetical protein